MPRSKTYCARGAGHPPPCATPERMEKQRSYARTRERVVTPKDKARWNRAHKFTRLGITEERFNQMLEEQGYTCAMCREPFGDDYPQVDHDQCGRCIRGLLCLRCNTALGYIELYGDLAKAYLGRPASLVGGRGFEPPTSTV